MGSLGTGELIVIAIAALVVFGPKRLPELAKRAGELLAKARTATRSLTESLDGDYGEIAAPLQTLKSEYDATVKEIKNIGTTVTEMGTTLPGETVEGEEAVDGSQSTVDGTEKEEADGEKTADGGETVGGEEAVDGSQSTVDGSEEEGTGTSDTVDRLPSTDDPSHTDDRDSSS